jgi:hypothetical protein
VLFPAIGQVRRRTGTRGGTKLLEPAGTDPGIVGLGGWMRLTARRIRGSARRVRTSVATDRPEA